MGWNDVVKDAASGGTELARSAGCELIFLLADGGDCPQQLY
ncbi:MAG TPA: hypothetical protein VNF24_02195 [Candidatus Acidoferrales bacterium]|nr:hypothetical protein [Candidatus Acidoferrales bacterium]